MVIFEGRSKAASLLQVGVKWVPMSPWLVAGLPPQYCGQPRASLIPCSGSCLRKGEAVPAVPPLPFHVSAPTTHAGTQALSSRGRFNVRHLNITIQRSVLAVQELASRCALQARQVACDQSCRRRCRLLEHEQEECLVQLPLLTKLRLRDRSLAPASSGNLAA